METTTIQGMTAPEVEQVADMWLALIGEHAICDRSYFTTYRRNYKRKLQLLKATLQDDSEQVWVARVDGELIGYCSVYMTLSYRVIGVLMNRRLYGIGSGKTQEIFRILKNVEKSCSIALCPKRHDTIGEAM